MTEKFEQGHKHGHAKVPRKYAGSRAEGSTLIQPANISSVEASRYKITFGRLDDSVPSEKSIESSRPNLCDIVPEDESSEAKPRLKIIRITR
jgi:hypothetical protein